MFVFLLDLRFVHTYSQQWVEFIVEFASATKDRQVPFGVGSFSSDGMCWRLLVDKHKVSMVQATLVCAEAVGHQQPCQDLEAALRSAVEQLRCSQFSEANTIVVLTSEAILNDVVSEIGAIQRFVDNSTSGIHLLICKDGRLTPEHDVALQDLLHFSYRTDALFVHTIVERDHLFRDPSRPLDSLGLSAWRRQALGQLSDIQGCLSVDGAIIECLLRPTVLHLPPELSRHWAALSRFPVTIQVCHLVKQTATELSQHLLAGMPVHIASRGDASPSLGDFVRHCQSQRACFVAESHLNFMNLSRLAGGKKQHCLGIPCGEHDKASFLLQGVIAHESVAPIPITIAATGEPTSQFDCLVPRQSFATVDLQSSPNTKRVFSRRNARKKVRFNGCPETIEVESVYQSPDFALPNEDVAHTRFERFDFQRKKIKKKENKTHRRSEPYFS